MFNCRLESNDMTKGSVLDSIFQERVAFYLHSYRPLFICMLWYFVRTVTLNDAYYHTCCVLYFRTFYGKNYFRPGGNLFTFVAVSAFVRFCVKNTI